MTVYRQGLMKLGATVVPVENVSIDPAVEEAPRKSAGDYYQTQRTVFGATPVVSATLPLDVALDRIGLQIAAFTAFEVQALQIDGATGIIKTGSTHTTWENASTDDIIYGCVQSFSAAQGGLATAQCMFYASAATPSTTHPFTRSDDNAALSLASQPDLHTLGGVTLNGSAIGGLDSVSFNMNHEVVPRKSDGDLYPSQVTWHGSTPSISVQHGDPQAVAAAINAYGDAIASSTTITFRARTAGIITTSATKTITIAGGHIIPMEIAGGVGDASTHAFQILPASSDGTTNPLSVS